MVIVHGYVELPAGIGNDVVDLPNIFWDFFGIDHWEIGELIGAYLAADLTTVYRYNP